MARIDGETYKTHTVIRLRKGVGLLLVHLFAWR